MNGIAGGGSRTVIATNNNNNNNANGVGFVHQSSLSSSSTSSNFISNANGGGGGGLSSSSSDIISASHKQNQEPRSKFDLPNIADDDVVLVENILHAVQSLGTEDCPLCVKYRVKVITTGYILSAFLPSSDIFEVDLDDLLFIKSISPSRIDSICVARTAAQSSTELIVKILDHKQRIMVTRSTSFSATRKRKFGSVS